MQPADLASIAAQPPDEWNRLLPSLVAAERHEAEALGRLLPSADAPAFLGQLSADIAVRASQPGGGLDLALTILGGWLARELRATGARRVALYGAGSHSSKLRAVWAAYGGPEVTVLLETDTPTRPEVDGTPVIRLDTLSRYDVDAIVLSSRWCETEMMAACGRGALGLPVFPVWHHLAHDPHGSRRMLDALLMRRIVPALARRVVLAGRRRVRLSGPESLVRLALPVWLAHLAEVSPDVWPTEDRPESEPQADVARDALTAVVYYSLAGGPGGDVGAADTWLCWPIA